MKKCVFDTKLVEGIVMKNEDCCARVYQLRSM